MANRTARGHDLREEVRHEGARHGFHTEDVLAGTQSIARSLCPLHHRMGRTPDGGTKGVTRVGRRNSQLFVAGQWRGVCRLGGRRRRVRLGVAATKEKRLPGLA